MLNTEPVPANAQTESRLKFQRSKTFFMRQPDPAIFRLRVGMVIGLLGLFYVVIPLMTAAGIVPDYKLTLLGKFLAFAIVALGLDLIWGYTGLLSLCQALFFCLGGYAMGMHLSLREGGGDVREVDHYLPQFLSFNNHTTLPGFWMPFSSFGLSVFLGIFVPAFFAGVVGFFIFRSRVRGVYFSIVTQAIAWGCFLLICRNEMLLGGTNGLTNFNKALTHDRGWIIGLYLITLTVLLGAYLLCLALVRSRLGRVLVAIRDKETRLYFAGYRPYAFKVFSFAAAAALAGIGGMLYTPQDTLISPDNMRVNQSITMVVWVALGGRGKLWGAIFGSLLVNYLYESLTSDIPGVWMYVLGGMAIIVVLVLPDGFVGIWRNFEEQVRARAGARALFFSIFPMAVLSVFVLCEALHLTPPFLQHQFTIGSFAVKWKYGVVLMLLGVCWVENYVRKRHAQAIKISSRVTILAGGTP